MQTALVKLSEAQNENNPNLKTMQKWEADLLGLGDVTKKTHKNMWGWGYGLNVLNTIMKLSTYNF